MGSGSGARTGAGLTGVKRASVNALPPWPMVSMAASPDPRRSLSRLAVGEMRRGALIRMNERAVGGEGRERRVQAGDQAADAFIERQIGPGRFRRDDQHAGLRAERDARALAQKRAAKARAEAAQFFEPRGGVMFQARIETRDRRRRDLRRIKALRHHGRDIVAAENRRADGVGKQNLPAVCAPEPDRQIARGVRSNPRVMQERKKRFRSIHQNQTRLHNLVKRGTD